MRSRRLTFCSVGYRPCACQIVCLTGYSKCLIFLSRVNWVISLRKEYHFRSGCSNVCGDPLPEFRPRAKRLPCFFSSSFSPTHHCEAYIQKIPLAHSFTPLCIINIVFAGNFFGFFIAVVVVFVTQDGYIRILQDTSNSTTELSGLSHII